MFHCVHLNSQPSLPLSQHALSGMRGSDCFLFSCHGVCLYYLARLRHFTMSPALPRRTAVGFGFHYSSSSHHLVLFEWKSQERVWIIRPNVPEFSEGFLQWLGKASSLVATQSTSIITLDARNPSNSHSQRRVSIPYVH